MMLITQVYLLAVDMSKFIQVTQTGLENVNNILSVLMNMFINENIA